MQAIEKFTIFCLESYKTARNINGSQALKDFEEYDVFAYLVQGYDVLHTQGKQFITADIEQYIAKRKKRMKLYHGSTERIEKPRTIVESNRFLDFGYGFYTTTSLEQATRWARIKKRRDQTSEAYVNIYEVDDTFLETLTNVLQFPHADKAWLEFVINNRRRQEIHQYDCVKGAVADDTLYETLSLYESGVLSVEETVVRLKVHHLFDQISFHNNNALSKLKFIEAIEV
jgi:hypothetical protein